MGTSHPPLVPPGRSTTIQINITRWTTPEEREALLGELRENGQEGLVKALQQQAEAGWVRDRSVTARSAATRARTGWSTPNERLRYAWQIDRGDGKRRIIAAVDRPISFTEAFERPRWRDFDVTLIVMDVDEKGQGEGQLAIGVQLEIDPDAERITIENYGNEPIRLTNVHRP